MESEELGKRRAAFSIALLWGITCLVFLLHRQGAVPLISFSGTVEKWPLVLLNILACSAVAFFPGSSIALGAAFVFSAVANLEWHSWLGALHPLVPLAFLCLLIFRRESMRHSLLDSLVIALAAGTLHRWNPVYLNGFEFLPGGTLYRDLPAAPWFAGHASAWAWIWLLMGIVPLPFLLKRNKLGFLLAALSAVAAAALYNVLFLGFFLLVPALFIWDPRFLLAWRSPRFPRMPSPMHVYFLGMITFFLWFLYLRPNIIIYCLILAFCGLAVLGASRFQQALIEKPSSGFRRLAWAAFLSVYALLPLAVPSIPAPFGFTQFSAREARFPPKVKEAGWRGMEDCEELKRTFALRWGYLAWQDGEKCYLLRFRN